MSTQPSLPDPPEPNPAGRPPSAQPPHSQALRSPHLGAPQGMPPTPGKKHALPWILAGAGLLVYAVVVGLVMGAAVTSDGENAITSSR